MYTLYEIENESLTFKYNNLTEEEHNNIQCFNDIKKRKIQNDSDLQVKENKKF